MRTLATAALLSCGALFVTGCAHHAGHERTGGEVIDDSAITIKVKTFEGIVQLSGFVDSQWQIDKAVQVTAAVTGVQKVKNDLVHKPVK